MIQSHFLFQSHLLFHSPFATTTPLILGTSEYPQLLINILLCSIFSKLCHMLLACHSFRCNNVLYVRGVDEEEEDGEMRE